ncbi:hypothetical protein ULMA_04160 [Patiriisocius marinus]|uniref:Lipoprotein n=1 Tax=Patiriisocius marinus TaxID=1397112 RepID=A0A5J4IXJ4_9FLAO|nr:hypothetical protein [Patiriisocius marinus]GER58308.1 hypothetical protein ULMA_04160 [Patiriisocius marinus]
MKLITIVLFIFAVGCGAPSKNTGPIIDSKTESDVITSKNNPTSTEPTVVKPILPKGAVIGNYNGDLKPFYAHVSKIDTKKGVTTVSFESKKYPDVLIPKTYGGTVAPLILEGFDRDLLLVTAKLEDPNFNKYFLYVLRNNSWKPVMNGFAIHKSNRPETLQVIRVNPENKNELIRYYSVFDIDETNEEGYVWRLLEESIVKQNW